MTNEQLYVLAVVSGMLRAEIEKLKARGLRPTAQCRVNPAKVQALLEDLLRRCQDRALFL